MHCNRGELLRISNQLIFVVSSADILGTWETCPGNLSLALGKIGLCEVWVLEGAQETHRLLRLMLLSAQGK